MQNRSFAQSLHFRDFEVLESRAFGMLWFRSRSGFDMEQNFWFCKAFYFSCYSSVKFRVVRVVRVL
ncbi:MAG TPA: hypothetical protein VKA34_09740 [Balneolales bacterium]|nr:hypothetical protein [Balneolales bacterium]